MAEPRQVQQVGDTTFLGYALHIELRQLRQRKAEAPEHRMLGCSDSGRIDAKRRPRVRHRFGKAVLQHPPDEALLMPLHSELEVLQLKLVRKARKVLVLKPDKGAFSEAVKRRADPSIGPDFSDVSKVGGKEARLHPSLPCLESLAQLRHRQKFMVGRGPARIDDIVGLQAAFSVQK